VSPRVNSHTKNQVLAGPRRAVPSVVLASLLAGWLLEARAAHAYRPFDGTDGDVAETGEFELEIGPLQYAQQGKDKFLSSPTVLNLGVIPRLELIMDIVPVYPTQGGPVQITNTDVLAKYVLRSGVLRQQPGPSIALEAGPLVPEVNGESGFGASADLIVSERWDWLSLHLNSEADLARKSLVFGWVESLIGEAELGAPVRPVSELSLEVQPSTHARAYGVLVGAIWHVAEGFDLDGAGRIARVDGTRAVELRMGLTWAIPVWHPVGPVESGDREK
jgi:hypothetical protein